MYKKFYNAKRFDPNKFRVNLVDQLLEGYDRSNYNIEGALQVVTENPMHIGARYFLSANKEKTASGKQAMPDCVVCSEREKK